MLLLALMSLIHDITVSLLIIEHALILKINAAILLVSVVSDEIAH